MPRPIGDHGGGRRRRTIVERNTGRSKNLICLLERGYRLGSEEGGGSLVSKRGDRATLGPYSLVTRMFPTPIEDVYAATKGGR